MNYEQLFADLPSNRFVTAWIGHLHADGRLETMSAGQAPLICLREATDECEVLGADAPPFGLLPPMPMPMPAATKLEVGDIFAVLSDGFYEAVDAADMEFGKDRISDLLRQHRRADAADILAALRAALSEGGAAIPGCHHQEGRRVITTRAGTQRGKSRGRDQRAEK